MSPTPTGKGPTPPGPALGHRPITLAESIAASASAATWLGPADAGAVLLAVRLAAVVEVGLGDPENARLVAPLASSLARVLTDLGLTARGRPPLAVPTEGVTWLDELRARRETPTGTKTAHRNPQP